MSKQTVPQQPSSDKSLASAAPHTATTSGVSLPAVPVLQLAFEGKRTIAEVPGLVKDLKEMGFLTDVAQRDLLVRILTMNRNFEQWDIINILSGETELGPDIAPRPEMKEKKRKQDESDEEDGSPPKYQEPKLPGSKQERPAAAAAPPAREDDIEVEFPPRTRAIIVWAGSALTDHRIGPIRAAYNQLFGNTPLKGQGEMEKEAGQLEKTAVFDGLPLNKAEIQQALEQESIHAEVIDTICSKLNALRLDPLIIRPPDSSLIFPSALQHRPWRPLGSPIDFSQTANSILITVGHGGAGGHTNFPREGLLDYTQIKSLLNIPGVESAVLYIPLQCYPQKAVEKGKAAGVPSVSINTEGVSSDGEMQDWIQGRLQYEIIQWARSRVGK